MSNQIEEKVKEIIVSQMTDKIKAANLQYDTPLLALGIDSIFALSILVDIEIEYNIEINNEDLNNIDKIKDISSFANLIRNYLKPVCLL